MESSVIKNRIEEIKRDPFYFPICENGVEERWYIVNHTYLVEEIGEINELNKSFTQFYIVTLQYYLKSRNSSYLHKSFEIIPIGKNMDEVMISCNGWSIDNLTTYGHNSYGDINKIQLKFRFKDLFGFVTDEFYLSNEESDMIEKVRQMVSLFKKYSECYSIKNYLLLQKIEELEEKIKQFENNH